jgi:hypothetical protein
MSDKEYLAQEGLKSTIMDEKSRKDIVAGGLGDHLWQGQAVESPCLPGENGSLFD